MALSSIRMLWSMQKKDSMTSLNTATALTGMFNFYFALSVDLSVNVILLEEVLI